jgi:PAS domain S-box-containing protein
MNSLDHFRIHFEHSPFSIQLLTPEGKTLAVNRAWKELWKIPEDVIQNYILTEYNVGTDPQLEGKGLGPIIRKGLTGETVEIPAILYAPMETGIKGTPKWVSGFMYPVRDLDGTLKEVVLTHQNITERKIAEEELRKSRDQLRIIFEGVLDGILVQDKRSKIIFANEAAARITGFGSSRELSETSLPDLLESFDIHDEKGDPYPINSLPARRAISGEGPQEDVVIKVRNSRLRKDTWLVVSSKAIVDESGEPNLAVSIFRDITEDKEREERQNFLNRATEALSTSLDYHTTMNKLASLSVPRLGDWCFIDIIEEDGAKTVAVAHSDPENLKLAESFNSTMSSTTVMQTGRFEFYPSISESLECFQNMKNLGTKSAIIVPLKLNEKILGAMTFICSGSGRTYNQTDLEMIRELSQRSALALENSRLYLKSEKLAQELQNAVRARDEFISICSHELKTPITSMKLQFALANRKLKAGDETVYSQKSVEKNLATTTRQLNRMVKLIDEMLDISRINTDKLEIEKVPLDLREVIEETLSNLSDQFQINAIEVNKEITNETCLINGDHFRLEQVFSNILNNAIKYGASRPINVRVRKFNSFVRLEFSDQGIGIAQSDFLRIFNRFERVTSVNNISGLGIGLYISKQIIEGHQGRIWVESDPSRGTTFFVELPAL